MKDTILNYAAHTSETRPIFSFSVISFQSLRVNINFESSSFLFVCFFKERARATLRDIGPAVWNGGFSTFLAVFLLAFSNSYVFKTFFKVSN